MPTPFFVDRPSVDPLVLGSTTPEVVLDADDQPRRYAYYSMTLPAGDYKTTVAFTRASRGHGVVWGTVSVLGREGNVQVSSLINVYAFDFSAKGVSKLSLADEAAVISKSGRIMIGPSRP